MTLSPSSDHLYHNHDHDHLHPDLDGRIERGHSWPPVSPQTLRARADYLPAAQYLLQCDAASYSAMVHMKWFK